MKNNLYVPKRATSVNKIDDTSDDVDADDSGDCDDDCRLGSAVVYPKAVLEVSGSNPDQTKCLFRS